MMRSDVDLMSLSPLAELHQLHTEALSIFERCLAEGNPRRLEMFIETHILREPPAIELLHEIADDLRQRLFMLQQYHFELKVHILRALHEEFDFDLATLAPPGALEQYHMLRLDDTIGYLADQNVRLSDQEFAALRKLLETALEAGAQRYHEIRITEHLLTYVSDWLMGLHILVARRRWDGGVDTHGHHKH
ncbi:MAG: hypothetical protein GYB67_10665 [Chloroflexi bacterium]|nr:hypothetical protein [Chloroflexota bacterium]